MRLLICLDCKTMEELPDFTGRPEDDVLLEDLASRHQGPAPVPHSPVKARLERGPEERHFGNVMVIEQEKWEKEHVREQILKETREALSGGTTGFEPEFYATKNTYVEDAGRCYNNHRRPQDFCIDWHAKEKQLGNPLKGSPVKVFLCDFCVVASRVNTKKAESGLWTP